MTDDRTALMEALQKADDGNFLRGPTETVLQILMEERATWRNGYRDRSLDTRLGQLNQRIPKLQNRQLLPALSRGQEDHREGAGFGHPRGVDRRRVDAEGRRPRPAMGLSAISKSQVSKLCKEIDEGTIGVRA